MKNLNSVLGLVSIIAIAIFSCCNTPFENFEMEEKYIAQTDERLSEANDDYLLDVESFKKEAEARISANEASIVEFKSLMLHSKREVKKKYSNEILELEQRNTEMNARLFEYKDEGRDKWNAFKKEFKRDMDELVNAFRKAGNSYGLHYS